jgi:hypothetical protein
MNANRPVQQRQSISPRARTGCHAEFDRSTSTIYFPPTGTLEFERITSNQERKQKDPKLDAKRGMNNKANRLIHPIPTSAAPNAFRPLGLLRTPVLELDSFIGIGDEGRSQTK